MALHCHVTVSHDHVTVWGVRTLRSVLVLEFVLFACSLWQQRRSALTGEQVFVVVVVFRVELEHFLGSFVAHFLWKKSSVFHLPTTQQHLLFFFGFNFKMFSAVNVSASLEYFILLLIPLQL